MPTLPEISSPLHIDVPLRQHRDYLHSTNLFDFLVQRTGVQEDLSLMFRQKVTAECDAFPAAEIEHAERCPVRFTGRTGAEAVDLVLVEREPRMALSRREPYDEEAVAAGSRIQDAAIFSGGANGATAIERIVALNKRLLTNLTQSQRVLVFSRLWLRRVPPQEADLEIRLESRLGQTLFRSAILANGERTGEIVFYGT